MSHAPRPSRPRAWPRRVTAAAALVLCVACVGLWVWGRDEAHFFHADFWHGSFDAGRRQWRGQYSGVCRGQLFFESETIRYTAAPTTRPANRWAAEDAVEMATPALRPFPFRGRWGFQYFRGYAVSPAGTLYMTTVAFPLWAVLVPSALTFLYATRRMFRRRRPVLCPEDISRQG